MVQRKFQTPGSQNISRALSLEIKLGFILMNSKETIITAWVFQNEQNLKKIYLCTNYFKKTLSPFLDKFGHVESAVLEDHRTMNTNYLCSVCHK